MNLQESLNTANWLLDRECLTEGETCRIKSIREMRDTLYFLWAAAGIPEICVQLIEHGQLPGS